MTFSRKTWDWEKGVIALLVVLMLLVFAGLIYKAASPTFTLFKSDWTCTETQIRNTMKPMIIGDKTTMVPSTESVCVEYRRH